MTIVVRYRYEEYRLDTNFRKIVIKINTELTKKNHKFGFKSFNAKYKPEIKV